MLSLVFAANSKMDKQIGKPMAFRTAHVEAVN